MPSESTPFTPSSILFRPHKSRSKPLSLQRFMVEAPGTAPGSEWFITMTVYRHSRLPGTTNISVIGEQFKGKA
jgi:hypothetical protein